MGLIEDFYTDREKLIKTAILSFAYITLGYGIAIIGPTMLDLSYLVDSTVSSMTYLLATRAIGTLISCLLTDFHKKYLSFEKILAISQLVMGITLFILPFFDLIGMNIVIFVYGYASGSFQVFGDLWTIRIWNKKRAAIYIQWIYFFFSMGAFIAPLLASPFLAATTKNDVLPFTEVDQLQIVQKPNQNSTNSTGLDNSELPIKHSIVDLKVMYPYMISGSYAILIAVILYIVDATNSNKANSRTKDEYKEIDCNTKDNEKPKSSNYTAEKYMDSAEEENRKPSCSRTEDENEKSALLNKNESLLNSAQFKVPTSSMPNFTLIKILSVLFVNLFIGFDVTFGTYLSVFVFVNDDFALSTQQGAYLTAAFWGAYTFAFRVPGYFIIQKHGPHVLMNIEMLITFFSTILLSGLIFSSSTALLWSSVILEGLGMSIVYSTYLAYLKTKFEPSARLCSAFVCAFCFGSFIYPTVVGIWIEQYPIIFIYLSIFCCLATTLIYVYVRYLFKKWN